MINKQKKIQNIAFSSHWKQHSEKRNKKKKKNKAKEWSQATLEKSMFIELKISNDAKLRKKKWIHINQKGNITVNEEKHTNKTSSAQSNESPTSPYFKQNTKEWRKKR